MCDVDVVCLFVWRAHTHTHTWLKTYLVVDQSHHSQMNSCLAHTCAETHTYTPASAVGENGFTLVCNTFSSCNIFESNIWRSAKEERTKCACSFLTRSIRFVTIYFVEFSTLSVYMVVVVGVIVVVWAAIGRCATEKNEQAKMRECKQQQTSESSMLEQKEPFEQFFPHVFHIECDVRMSVSVSDVVHIHVFGVCFARWV